MLATILNTNLLIPGRVQNSLNCKINYKCEKASLRYSTTLTLAREGADRPRAIPWCWERQPEEAAMYSGHFPTCPNTLGSWGKYFLFIYKIL